jgi:hypothetical protein
MNKGNLILFFLIPYWKVLASCFEEKKAFSLTSAVSSLCFVESKEQNLQLTQRNMRLNRHQGECFMLG